MGSMLIIVGVGGLCVGLTLLSQKIFVYAGLSLAISVIGFIIFVIVELRHPEAVLPLYLMKNPVADLAVTHILVFITLSANLCYKLCL